MITVFTGPGCGQCVATKAHLRKRKVSFEEVRVDENPEWSDLLKSHGFSSVPVVLVAEEDVWAGYSSESIEEWALELSESA